MSALVYFRPVRCIAVLALAASILAPSARATTSEDAKIDPTITIQAWLEEIDAGDYTQSWKEAAPALQKALSPAQWAARVKSFRVPLGKNTSRTFDTAEEQTTATTQAGTLHGDFIVAQFDATFAHMKYAVETVIFEQTPSGEWRAVGYSIKPGS